MRDDRRRRRCSTKSCRSSTRSRSNRGRPSWAWSARRPDAPARSTNIAAGRSIARSTPRHARPAAHGQRRLERRHESRRPRPAGARACGSASFCTRCSRSSRSICEASTASAAPDGTGPRRPRSRTRARSRVGRRWFRRGYYDDGTPLGSATNDECADRLDRAERGRCCRRRVPAALAERAMDAVRAQLIDARPELGSAAHAAVRSHPRRIPATSRAIRRASARTAGSTRTRPLGRDGDRQARQRRRSRRALPHAQPDQPHAHARRSSSTYKAEPYVLAGDITMAPRTAGRAGWTWYTGSAGWMYRTGLERLLGLRRRGTSFQIDLVHSGRLAVVRDHVPVRIPRSTKSRCSILIINAAVSDRRSLTARPLTPRGFRF